MVKISLCLLFVRWRVCCWLAHSFFWTKRKSLIRVLSVSHFFIGVLFDHFHIINNRKCFWPFVLCHVSADVDSQPAFPQQRLSSETRNLLSKGSETLSLSIFNWLNTLGIIFQEPLAAEYTVFNSWFKELWTDGPSAGLVQRHVKNDFEQEIKVCVKTSGQVAKLTVHCTRS